MIEYSDRKDIPQMQLEALFLSVGWESAKYPERLVRAMRGFSTVFTAWEGDRLCALIAVLDDGEMTAYVHYLLVHPDMQHRGIGGELIRRVTQKYDTYTKIVLHAEGNAAPFYEKLGFSRMAATAMQLLPQSRRP